MAALQPARPRAAANPSRQLQPRGSLLVNGAASISSGGSSSGGSSSGAPSPLSVFLTNLRLLDLDLRPDWPGLSPQTFASSGVGVQGQKKRVQCVEWALFHLFSLWDPQETANKLKPFFPPLDQLQSLNLRAALLRALENAKKNGVLGRDSIIRKTLLDECKGERLEEVLAYFSAAVLKKAVAHETDRGRRSPTAALKLAVENRGYSGNNAELAALTLAHKVSLRRFLERKELTRTRYGEFADLVGVKERSIARRNEAIRATEEHGAQALSDNAREEMRRTVRNNWSGDEKWIETLLPGDSRGKGSGLLAMPFDRVWRRVQQGSLAEMEEDRGGLLDQLDNRVRIQKERLARWHAFRRDVYGHADERPPSRSKVQEEGKTGKGIDFCFGGHQDLQVGGLAARAMGVGKQDLPITAEYRSLVDGLRDELAQIRGQSCKSTGFLATCWARLPTDASDQDEISEMGDLDDEADQNLPAQPAAGATGAKLAPRRLPARLHSRKTDGSSAESSAPCLLETDALHPLDHDMPILDPAGRKSLWDDSSSHSPSPQRFPERQAESAQHLPSPTRDLADQILESMDQASPSPAKRPKPRHTLSLAQRTRLSMARMSNPFLDDDEEPEPELPPGPAAATAVREAVNGGQPLGGGEDVAEDLVSRTRRSMAGFDKARQKAQMERRRSQRRSRVPSLREGSFFPPVDEAAAQERNELTEELMREEDMEAVFRSRPKVKASPIPSPTREWEDSGE